jgi:hypothetical protein
MSILDPILSWPPISRVRRNHALEHASLQILAKKNPHQSAAGYSDTKGFWVLGEVSTDALQEAVDEALARLRAGEWQLAIHPNCGTNFVAAGMVGGGLAWLSTLTNRNDWRGKLERLPLMVTLITLGTILAQPLGLKLQQILTTDAQIGELQVIEIARLQRKDTPIHRVRTAH